MENVRGMLNKSDEIMQDFSTNLINYKTTIFMLNAKEFGFLNTERGFLYLEQMIKILMLMKLEMSY